MRARLTVSIIGLILVAFQVLLSPAMAQDDKLSKQELDQLLAPIALYPDDLLTNMLMASTYPLDVVQAARWRKEPANAKLKDDALTKALEAKTWDPSIKALVQFPDVLQQMSDKLDWTQKLGDAFLAQQDEVMDQIQFLRQKADEAGNLKSNKQQKISKESGDSGSPVYIIEPASPDVVYVPYYEPTVVYGPWWYDDYPPYYWGYPGASYVNGYWWGAGIGVAAGIWGWNHFDWHRHDIDIDVNKWNNINVDRNKITDGKWEHRPDHRGPVPYKNKDVRDKFAKGDARPGSKDDFRGRDVDRAKVEQRLKDTDHSKIKDRPDGGPGDKMKDKVGDRGPGDKMKDRPGDGGGQKLKDRPGDGGAAKMKDKGPGPSKGKDIAKRPASKPAAKRPSPKKPSPAAFDVKRGADVRQAANRGHASRQAMGGGRSVSRGGGGGGRGGGGRGGGGRGGGRR
jgi:hypothetical protein